MASEIQTRVLRKITWRIVPFIMLLYFVAFIDRVNIGFASLTMNKDLGLSPTVYGFGAGIFFWGYFLFEVPSNIILRQGRRADLDRAGDDHLGPGLGGDGLRAGPDQLLRPALPARRRRSRLLSRHHPLSLLLVPGAPARRGDRAVHGGGAALDRAGLAGLRRAAGDGRPARLQGLAMAVRARGAAGGAARLRRAGVPDRPARRRRNGLRTTSARWLVDDHERGDHQQGRDREPQHLARARRSARAGAVADLFRHLGRPLHARRLGAADHQAVRPVHAPGRLPQRAAGNGRRRRHGAVGAAFGPHRRAHLARRARLPARRRRALPMPALRPASSLCSSR